MLSQLNARLLEAFRAKSDDLYLAVPSIIDYQDALHIMFSGAGPSLIYEDVFINLYYQYLASRGKDLGAIEIADLKSHSLLLTNEDGDRRQSFSIFKSLVFDTTLDEAGAAYHLAEGNWYRVATSYVEELRAFLDPYYTELELPPYAHENEGAYNTAVHEEDANYLCLDQTSISPPGQSTVEPCDLYSVPADRSVLWHVKRSTLSPKLSHLFNQGTNSIELLKLDQAARANLQTLILEKAPPEAAAALSEPIEKGNFEVVFAIITHKGPARKSRNLPLFSRVSLRRSLKALRLMNVFSRYGFVVDASPTTPGKKKGKRSKSSKGAAAAKAE